MVVFVIVLVVSVVCCCIVYFIENCICVIVFLSVVEFKVQVDMVCVIYVVENVKFGVVVKWECEKGFVYELMVEKLCGELKVVVVEVVFFFDQIIYL